MIKKTTFIAQEYTSPCVKIIETKSQHVLCTSFESDNTIGSAWEEDLGTL